MAVDGEGNADEIGRHKRDATRYVSQLRMVAANPVGTPRKWGKNCGWGFATDGYGLMFPLHARFDNLYAKSMASEPIAGIQKL
eukprot:3911621-Amphidinium_carterae.1